MVLLRVRIATCTTGTMDIHNPCQNCHCYMTSLIIYAEISSKVYAFRNLAFNVYGRNFFILSAVPKLRDKNVIGTNFCIYNQSAPSNLREEHPNSPLHSYLRVFSWFLILICHLKKDCVKRFITDLIAENLRTNIHDVRRCFIRKSDDNQDLLYWILTVILNEARQPAREIYNNLGAILYVFNCN